MNGKKDGYRDEGGWEGRGP